MGNVVSAEHLIFANTVRAGLAALSETEDGRSLGLPVSNPLALAAEAQQHRLEAFLRQGEICIKPDETLAELRALADTLGGPYYGHQQRSSGGPEPHRRNQPELRPRKQTRRKAAILPRSRIKRSRVAPRQAAWPLPGFPLFRTPE